MKIICQLTTSSNFRIQGRMVGTACNWPLKEPTSGTTSQGCKNSPPQKKMLQKKLVHLKIHPQQEKERNIHKIDPNHHFYWWFQPLIFAAPGIWTPKQPWLHPPKRWHSSVKHRPPNSMEMYHLMLGSWGKKNFWVTWLVIQRNPGRKLCHHSVKLELLPFAGSCLHALPEVFFVSTRQLRSIFCAIKDLQRLRLTFASWSWPKSPM